MRCNINEVLRFLQEEMWFCLGVKILKIESNSIVGFMPPPVSEQAGYLVPADSLLVVLDNVLHSICMSIGGIHSYSFFVGFQE